jgi:DNA-binding NarL/FixJ family response regulator
VIRVLILAPYAALRAGLQALLAGEEDLALVSEVSGSAELEALLPETLPDVVLADLNGSDGPHVIAAVAASEAGLVAIGAARDGFRQLAAQPLRGWAYLLNEADGAEMAAAIRAVAAGLVVLDRSLAAALVGTANAVTLEPGGAAALEPLTPREREVLQLMAQGLPNKAIARELRISLHTAKFHVASILGKLGAASRTEAVTLGARQGLVIL